METEALRLSSGALRTRLIALWERVLRISRRAPRYLRLCESLPLGDRRFVAVVEFEKERFLLGGTPSSLVLLSRLGDARTRAEDETGSDLPQSAGGSAGDKPGKNQSGEKRGEKC
ncbi:MAG: flagellar biosynthetic protein FliO [Candidatus Sulfotelmatobacter sp.]